MHIINQQLSLRVDTVKVLPLPLGIAVHPTVVCAELVLIVKVMYCQNTVGIEVGRATRPRCVVELHGTLPFRYQ